MVSLLTYGRAWNESTGSIVDSQAVGKEIFESMSMCDFDTLIADVGRIATAMENIDAKVAQIYSWQQFIDDLEAAFGVNHLLYQLVSSIFGLMPNFKNLDMTWLARSIWDYATYRGPVISFLTAIAAAQAVQAAAAATGRILSILDTVMAGLTILQTTALGWKDIIFGDKSIWSDLIMPLWAYFISDADGGQGGDDPDADPANRIHVRVNLDAFDDNLVPKLEEIRSMLETRLTAETQAGNTRTDQLEAMLNAIEDVIGGTFEPGG